MLRSGVGRRWKGQCKRGGGGGRASVCLVAFGESCIFKIIFFENIAKPTKLLGEPDQSSDGEFHQRLIKDIDCFLGLTGSSPAVDF